MVFNPKEGKKKYLDEKDLYFQQLYDKMSTCVAIYDPIEDGKDFRIVDINKAGEKHSKVKRDKIVGKKVTEVFPGVKGIGLFDVFVRVYKNGDPIFHPLVNYKDGRLEEWVENYVFKLPSGLIVAMYEDTSDTHNAQKALKESEEKYRSLTNQLPVGVYRTTPSGEIIYSNPALVKMLGYKSMEELQNLNVKDFFINKRQRNEQIKTWITNHDKVLSTEIKLLRKDGKVLIVRDTGKAITDKDDHVIYFDGIIEDVTELRKSAIVKEIIFSIVDETNKLSKLNQLAPFLRKELSKVFDTSNFFIVFYNENTKKYKFLFFRDQFDSQKFTTKKNYDLKDSLTDQIRKSKKARIFRNKGKKKDDRVIYGKPSKVWMGAPLIDSKGSFFGAIAVQDYSNPNSYNHEDLRILDYIAKNISNIIEKKRNEEAIIESENKYHEIFEGVRDGIIYSDSRGKILDVNKSFTKITGISKEQVIGKTSLQLAKELIKGKDVKQLVEIIKANLRGVAKNDFELLYKNKILQISTFRDRRRKNITGLIRDVTNEKRFERELIKAKEKAEESDRLKSAFLANMSHEIRTPMNGIIGFSELLNKPNLSEEKKNRFSAIIRDNSQQLLNIVNDVLDISKIETGQVELFKERFKIGPFLEDLHMFFKFRADEKNLKFEIVIEDDISDEYLVTDKGKLRQVMNNLLSNAFKFTDKGIVQFGVSAHHDYLKFYVKDSGIGIPKDKYKLIFDRFIQVENMDSKIYGGTGLGLAISKGIVDLLGGEIWLESTVEKGTTFYFTLPQKVKLTRDYDPQRGDLRKKIKSAEIMLVEDNHVNTLLFEELFEEINSSNMNLKLFTYESAERALRDLDQKKFDLVLMDIKLGGMNGLEATKIIKKKYPDLPVIAQSAYALSEDKNKVLNSGCDGYLSKPLSKEKLIETISKFLKP